MYTHFLMGILIQKIFFYFFPPSPLIWLIILILSFLSHWLIDPFSYVTFHPDENYDKNHPNDHIRKYITIIAAILTASIGIYFIFFTVEKFRLCSSLISPNCYFFTMLAAWFVDVIDWIIVRNLAKKGIIDKKYFALGILHPTINKFRETVFPKMPNWREKKWAFGVDLGITALLALFVFLL
jgi:hypothetical protein